MYRVYAMIELFSILSPNILVSVICVSRRHSVLVNDTISQVASLYMLLHQIYLILLFIG